MVGGRGRGRRGPLRPVFMQARGGMAIRGRFRGRFRAQHAVFLVLRVLARQAASRPPHNEPPGQPPLLAPVLSRANAATVHRLLPSSITSEPR
jgi:hypothetical protein